MYYRTNYKSPMGDMMLASDGRNLTGLWFEGQKYYGSTVELELHLRDDLPVFTVTKNWLERYFAGERPEISELSLLPHGSEFRQEVWKLLCGIPYGEVTTYGELARQIAKIQRKPGMSAQAVGGAVSHNPISIIIPCHRVVSADGSLNGYAGGTEKKEKLLALEGVDVSKLHIF